MAGTGGGLLSNGDCPNGGDHEKYIPIGNEPDWDLMTWDQEPDLRVNICKKCSLVYAVKVAGK